MYMGINSVNCILNEEQLSKCNYRPRKSWSPRLPLKLRDSGSILGRISTQGLEITEEKELPLH